MSYLVLSHIKKLTCRLFLAGFLKIAAAVNVLNKFDVSLFTGFLRKHKDHEIVHKGPQLIFTSLLQGLLKEEEVGTI